MGVTTLYVRPGANDKDGAASYGDDSGSDYDNAIPGLENVDFSIPQLELYVGGIHLPVNSIVNKAFNLALESGVAANRKTIIRGDVPGDPGMIWNYHKPNYAGGWTDNEDGTFSITIVGPSVMTGYSPTKNTFCVENVNQTEGDYFTLLTRADSAAECVSTDGSYYSSDYFVDSELMVNPLGADIEEVVFGGGGRAWGWSGLDNIIFYKLGVFGGPGNNGQNKGMIWSNCKRAFAGLSCWYHRDDSYDLRWWRCEGWLASAGITMAYTDEDSDPPKNVFGGRNYIHDIGNNDDTMNGDAHGLSCQNGDNFKWIGNIFDACQNTVTYYAWPSAVLTNMLNKNELIRNAHIYADPSDPRHYQWNRGPCDMDLSGNKAINCIVRGGSSDGFHGYQPNYQDAVTLDGCIDIDCDVGIAMNKNDSSGSGNAYVRNHRSINPATGHFALQGGAGVLYDGDNNTFEGSPTNFGIVSQLDVGDGTATDLAEWQAFEKEGCVFDPNSEEV